MAGSAAADKGTAVTFTGATAGSLMVPNPVSIRDSAGIPEAVALLTDHGIHAAPVIDEAGRPVGVLSQTDLLIHTRERLGGASPAAASSPGGSPEGQAEPLRVRDLMTPAVFAVPLNYPAHKVVADLVRLNVHQLFVVDPTGVLVGVVSSHDVLRRLAAEDDTGSETK